MSDLQSLQALLSDHQPCHSDFQMDRFITGRAGGTVYGQYKQALRELHKRYRGLKDLYAERELCRIDADELAQPPKPCETEFDARRNKVKLVQKRLTLDELGRSIAETEREFRRFYAQAAALKGSVGELTPERRAQLDREMWAHRLRCMAAVDLLTAGRLGPSTIELLQAVPRGWRKAILAEVSDQEGALKAWFLDFESPLPALEVPESKEPLALP